MTNLVAYRRSSVTPDTAEALRLLEVAAKQHGGVRVGYKGVAAGTDWEAVTQDGGPLGLTPPLSMMPTGREIYLEIQKLDGRDSMAELAILWSLAIPLGFMPWARYPVPGPHSKVFHFLGPWRKLVSFLHGEGRGELAWPSACAAAQIEVGTWGGDRLTECTVQMHLHRLGVHCGPVDGTIGSRTLGSLKALGFAGLPLTDAAEALSKIKSPEPRKGGVRKTGYFAMKDAPVEVFTSGGVHTTRTQTGWAVTVDSPGRLVALFGDST